MISRVFYLCNGKKKDCKKRTCYQKGGICRHTTDINYATNFERKGNNGTDTVYEKEDVSFLQNVLNWLNKIRQKR